nr:uncharacterized protein LOC129427911 isoform X2 [Misgurnus anguillicaudatus]
MELFIITLLHLLMQVQSESVSQAKLSVSSSVIMDTDTVQLECRNSENQKMKGCYFTTEGRGSLASGRCQLSLTGFEIIEWSGGQRSEVTIACHYTAYISQVYVSSPSSDPVTVTVQGFRQAKLSASSSVIMDRDTVQLECSNSENQMMKECYFIIDGRENNRKQSKSCQLSLTGFDISIWSGGQRSSVIITCYYNAYKLNFLMASSRSDPVTVHISTSTTTVRTTTTTVTTTSVAVVPTSRVTTYHPAETTTYPEVPTTKYYTPGVMLTVVVISVIAIFIIVPIGVICLRRFNCTEKCLHPCLVTENFSKDSGSDDVHTMVVYYSTSTWQPQSTEDLKVFSKCHFDHMS